MQGTGAVANVLANTVIVFGPSGTPVGLFVYKPGTDPALGNPPTGWVTNQAADPYGNPLPPATSGTYDQVLQIFAGLLGGSAVFGVFPAGTTSPGRVGLNGVAGGDLVLTSGTQDGGDTQAQVDLRSAHSTGGSPTLDLLNAALLARAGGSVNGAVFDVNNGLAVTGGATTDTETVTGALTATGGTPGSPTVVTTDASGAGITPSLNGWTGGTGANKVTLQPDRNVYIELDGLAGTLTSGTQVTTVPAGYRPATDIRKNCVTNGATAAPLNTPYVKILATGAVQVFNLPAGTSEIFLNGTYPLF